MTKSTPRPNDLRMYRKRSGLTLGEIAYLLGAKAPSDVYRFECSQRVPSFPSAMAYESLFSKPVQELFTELMGEVDWGVRARAAELIDRLGEAPFEGRNRQKCEFLAAFVRSKQRGNRARR